MTNELATQLAHIANRMESLEARNELLFAQIRNSVDQLGIKVNDMSEIISGNGDTAKGMIVRLSSAEAHITSHAKQLEEQKDWRRWATRGAITTAVTAFGSVALWVLDHFKKP